jgi:hypothetical protein
MGMSTGIEQRLREDMDQFTRDIQVPAGLAAKAYKACNASRRKSKRRTTRLLMACGLTVALAGGAGAVTVVSIGPRPANGQRVETAAYVIPQVRHALSVAELNNMVVYTRLSHVPALTWQPIPGGATAHGSTRNGAQPGAYATIVTYQGRWKFSAFAQDGQLLFSELVVGKGPATTTAVIYSGRTWWIAVSPAKPQPGKTTECVTNGDFRAWNGPSGDWPRLIQDELSCGAFKTAGTQVVDGVNAIKMTGLSGTYTIWVDPATYLPVKLAITRDGALIAGQDFQWLSPTSANRALLDLPVPAGFRRTVSPS